MRVIGLIGGTSWESTAVYYRLLNEEIKRRVGGSHSARILIVSLDGGDLEEFHAPRSMGRGLQPRS